MLGNPSRGVIQSRHSLSDLWKIFKESIFNVLFVMLDKASQEGQETISDMVFESGLDYLQMIAFPFNGVILGVWNYKSPNLVLISHIIVNYLLSLSSVAFSFSYTVFLIAVYTTNLVIILLILDVIYVSYSFSQKKFKFTFPLVLLAHIVPMFVTFLFLPFLEMLLSIINCNPSSDDPTLNVMQYYPEIVCFQGWHLFHTIVTCFFTFLFVTIATVSAMTLFEPRMTSPTLTARQSSTGEVLFIVNKSINQFFFSFAPFDSTWIYCLLLFIPSLGLLYFYHVKKPYYNSQVSKFFRICSAYYFWSNLMLLVSQILLGLNFTGGMIIWISGLLFIGLTIYFEKGSNVNLISSSGQFKTDLQLEAHLHCVSLLMHNRNKDKISSILLTGYIEKHIEKCTEDDCPIKAKPKKKETPLVQIEERCKLLERQLERMFRQGIKKFPHSAKLHISFAFFYLEKMKNYTKAYCEFCLAETCSPSFVEQFIIYRFKKITSEGSQEEHYEEGNDEQGTHTGEEESDLVETIRFDNSVSLCQQGIQVSSALHKQFWSQLQEQIPNLAKLNNLGAKINEAAERVKTNYRQICEINSKSPEILYNYSMYLLLVSQNPVQSKKVLAEAKQCFEERLGQQANHAKAYELQHQEKKDKNKWKPNKLLSKGHTDAIAIVSGDTKCVSKILQVNEYFTEMTGYSREQISEKTLDRILPECFGKQHLQAMLLWLEDQDDKLYLSNASNAYFHEIRKGYLRHKSNFIIPVAYQVTYDVYQDQFIALFRSDQQHDCLSYEMHLIVDATTTVRDVSALAEAHFGRSRQNHQGTHDKDLEDLGIFVNQQILEQNGMMTYLPEVYQPQKVQADNSSKMAVMITAKRITMPARNVQDPENIQNTVVGTVIIVKKIKEETLAKTDIRLGELNSFSEQVLQLYDHYEHISIFLEGLMRTYELLTQNEPRKQYGFGIRTYRYFNSELKRVYYDDEESEKADDSQQSPDKQFIEHELAKLKVDYFVEKIKRAIHAGIQHKEISSLKKWLIVFALASLGCHLGHFYVTGQVYSQLKRVSEDNMNWVNDATYLSSAIDMILSTTTSQQTNFSMYNISFGQTIMIKAVLQTEQLETVSLKDAMITLQSRIVSYSNLQLFNGNLSDILELYYESVLPSLVSFSNVDVSLSNSIFLWLTMALGVSLILGLIWIYNAMKLQQRCSSIILWFLEIPLSYVRYLSLNCHKFIKNYVTVKEIEKTGLDFANKNTFVDQFNPDKSKEDDVDEDTKSRKIIIKRHKQRNLLSRFYCSYAWIFLLLLYTLAILMAATLLLASAIRLRNLMNNEWEILGLHLINSCAISNNLKLMQNNLTTVSQVQLFQLEYTLQAKFRTFVSDNQTSFALIDLLSQSNTLETIYSEYFLSNCCEQPAFNSTSTECSDLLRGKLKGGIGAYFAYLTTTQNRDIDDISKSQFTYITPLLIQLLSAWKSYFDIRVQQTQQYSAILLYLDISLTALGVFLLWHLHLNRCNHRVNQTIQMLYMIPLAMLPTTKTDLREFFYWIIKEADQLQITHQTHTQKQ